MNRFEDVPGFRSIEYAGREVSLDQILRAFAAAAGRIAFRQVGRPGSKKTNRRKRTNATATLQG